MPFLKQTFPKVNRMSVTAELASRLLFSIASCRRRVEQRLRVLEVARVEPLSEPAVDRSE